MDFASSQTTTRLIQELFTTGADQSKYCQHPKVYRSLVRQEMWPILLLGAK